MIISPGHRPGANKKDYFDSSSNKDNNSCIYDHQPRPPAWG
jgi:hypothetical protein